MRTTEVLLLKIAKFLLFQVYNDMMYRLQCPKSKKDQEHYGRILKESKNYIDTIIDIDYKEMVYNENIKTE